MISGKWVLQARAILANSFSLNSNAATLPSTQMSGKPAISIAVSSLPMFTFLRTISCSTKHGGHGVRPSGSALRMGGRSFTTKALSCRMFSTGLGFVVAVPQQGHVSRNVTFWRQIGPVETEQIGLQFDEDVHARRCAPGCPRGTSR